MAAVNAEGIILRKYFLRETSYILIIFTKEFGKIRGVLKGARNPYPQFAGNFEIFTQVDVLFYKKRNKLDLITGCEAKNFFLPIRKDIERLTYANYFIELIDAVTSDYDANEELYEILAKGLELLAEEVSPKRAARIFELKLLNAIGWGPCLDSCLACSSSELENFTFSIDGGGVFCGGCKKENVNSITISRGTLNFLRKISTLPFNKTRHIKVSKEVGSEAERVLKSFIQYHIGKKTKSMQFLEKAEKKGIFAK